MEAETFLAIPKAGSEHLPVLVIRQCDGYCGKGSSISHANMTASEARALAVKRIACGDWEEIVDCSA